MRSKAGRVHRQARQGRQGAGRADEEEGPPRHQGHQGGHGGDIFDFDLVTSIFHEMGSLPLSSRIPFADLVFLVSWWSVFLG